MKSNSINFTTPISFLWPGTITKGLAMKSTLLMMSVLILVSLGVGCQGLKMDYGQPAAQFLEADVAWAGTKFLGKKITILGLVTRVDVSKPPAVSVHLGHGIICDFSDFPAMAGSLSSGDTALIDGILNSCEDGAIEIDSAMLRDPTAPFTAEN